MADEVAVVADSASGAETAPSEAAGTPDVTHGDQTDAATTTVPGAETGAEPGDDDDPETEPAEGDSPEEAKSKAEKRRERRKQREEERIARAVQERLDAAERDRQTKAEAAKAEAAAEALQDAWRSEFGELVGTPEVRDQLAREIDELIATTTSIDAEMGTNEDLQRLVAGQKTLAEKQATMKGFNQAAEMYRRLDKFQFAATQAVFAAQAAGIPEGQRASYLSARTVDEALPRLVAGIRADEQAKAKAASDKLEAEWRGRFEKEVAAHAATRTGAPGNGPAPNSANGIGGGSGMPGTLEHFRSLPPDRRQKLRREHPEYVDDLYRRGT